MISFQTDALPANQHATRSALSAQRDAYASEECVVEERDGFASSALSRVSSDEVQAGESVWRREALGPEEWTEDLEDEFFDLLSQKADGTLSGDNEKRYDVLVKLRRQLHHPRTAEEVLYDYKQARVENRLLKALDEYIGFFKTPR